MDLTSPTSVLPSSTQDMSLLSVSKEEKVGDIEDDLINTSVLSEDEYIKALESKSSDYSPTKEQSDAQDDSGETIQRTVTLQTTQVLHQGDLKRLQKVLLEVFNVKKVGVQLSEQAVHVVYVVNKSNDNDKTVANLTSLLMRNGYKFDPVQNEGSEHGSDSSRESNAPISYPLRSVMVQSTFRVSPWSPRQAAWLQQVTRQHVCRQYVRQILIGYSTEDDNSVVMHVHHHGKLLSATKLAQTWRDCGNLQVDLVTDGAQEELYLALLEDYNDDEDRDENDALIKTTENDGNDENNNRMFPRLVYIAGIWWSACSFFSFIPDIPEIFATVSSFATIICAMHPIILQAYHQRSFFQSHLWLLAASLGAIFINEWHEASSVAFFGAVAYYWQLSVEQNAKWQIQDLSKSESSRSSESFAHWIQYKRHASDEGDSQSTPMLLSADEKRTETRLVPPHLVPIGSFVSVRPGEPVLVPGIIVRSNANLSLASWWVDVSSATGRPRPIQQSIGDRVVPGTINLSSDVMMIRTTAKVSAPKSVKKEIDMSTFDRWTQIMAKLYTRGIVVMAVFMCTFPWLAGSDVGHYWMWNGLILLVIAARPGALTMSTVVTQAAGLRNTSSRGISIKHDSVGNTLESLGQVATVLFDKTGTLTRGKLQTANFTQIDHAMPREKIMQLLVLIEQNSVHPHAHALTKAAEKEGIELSTDLAMSDYHVLPGEGLEAVVEGDQVWVGNERLFKRLGMYQNLSDRDHAMVMEWSVQGHSVGFIGIEEQGILAAYSLTDQVRPEALDVTQVLIQSGYNVKILTGDSETAAQAVAMQIGLSKFDNKVASSDVDDDTDMLVHSNLLPVDKLRLVGEAQQDALASYNKSKKVLYCGDGVNDGPSLNLADVGVCMGNGANEAIMRSNVVLSLDNSLVQLLYVLDLGKRLLTILRINVGLVLLFKAVIVILCMSGHMRLLYAVVSDVLLVYLVALNGNRLDPVGNTVRRRQKTQHKPSTHTNVKYSEVSASLAKINDIL